MKHSKEIRDFIAEAEGFRDKAYRPLAHDVWTIGYGSTTVGGRPVKEGDTITREKALLELDHVLKVIDICMNNKDIPVSVTQQQYDAVVSLVYNIGFHEFYVSNTGRNFYKGLNISEKFPLWCYSGKIKVQGLLNRRLKEKQIYVSGIYK